MADIIVVLIVIVLLGFALRGAGILKVTVPAVAAEPVSSKLTIKN